ncbi:VRK serine/threonine kinase 3 [Phyllostomus discolor]|uniref:VRK serine/threonine kinase 3 n=1 Tax=Phyllostomus discolor TaxID=89673 RepID=A0A833YNF3_9CHIR|nr:VRK serine/threonine kinase 3 [Phyllostomus discolor]
MSTSCSDCGNSIKTVFKFCPYCGKPLSKEEPERSQTSVKPLVSSFRGSPKTPPTRKRNLQATKRSPQTVKRSWATTLLKALPTGTVLTDKCGRHWKLGAVQNRDDQGILYEAESFSTCESTGESSAQKQRFSLKLDAKDGRLFNEQHFFLRAAKPLQVDKWKKLQSTPLLAIPTCVGFGIHEDRYRFLVFPMLGRSLQSALDDSLQHTIPMLSVFQLAYRLLDALEFLHENEYVHGNVTADNIFVNPEDLSQGPSAAVTSSPWATVC